VHERLLAMADEASAGDALNVAEAPRLIADGLGRAADGLYDVEVFQNQAFRWTKPLSVWRLTGLRNDWPLTFRTHCVRFDLNREQVVFLLNGRRAPADQIAITPDELTVDLRGLSAVPSKPATLLIAVPPLRPWRVGQPDDRELGLPVISVGTSQSAAATDMKTAA
jgi:hypothetical protein